MQQPVAAAQQLLRLAARWDVSPERMLMVGDYRFDLDCARAAGARGVVLGCTEIPLLVSAGDTSLPLFDTTALHARFAADFALG